jgi:EF hand
MSASTVSSGSAYAYLQSLLQQQQSSTGGAPATDPLMSLIDAFYPSDPGAASSSTPASTSTTTSADATSIPLSTGPAQFSPNTFGALISLQSQQSWPDNITAKAQSVFSEFDTNGDGSISKSEFENAFGSNADMSKVDGLFSALDTNGDGSISQSELTSAAQQSQAQHRHHHCDHTGSSGSGGANDPLASLMSAIQGANGTTTNNPDGSTTTTITYADGSTVTMNVPAPSSSSQNSNNGSSSQDPASNVLEQLIQLQEQMLAQSVNTTTLPIPTI